VTKEWNGRQNGLNHEQLDNSTKDLFGIGFNLLFSELYKNMANKVTFVGFFCGVVRPNLPPLAGAVHIEQLYSW